MICVECGRTVSSLIDGACTDCFLAKAKMLVVPEVLDVEVCAHCDARHVGNHWIDPEAEDDLADVREQAVRAAARVHERARVSALVVSERQQDERNFDTTLSLDATVEGTAIHEEARLTVRVRRSVCDRCSRIFGGFYASIMQFRGTGRNLTQREMARAERIIGSELDRMRATGNREAFLAKQEEEPGGRDYYFGDIEGARGIVRLVAQKMGATVVETAKLVGRALGADIFRVTFLVRIRRFSSGDFASHDENVYEVDSLARGNCIVWDLEDFHRTKVEEDLLKRLGGAEILERAVVVARSGTELQILDPQTFKTVEVRAPPELVAGGEVWVLRFQERLYLPLTALPDPEPVKPRRIRKR